MKIPQYVIKAMNSLNHAGYECYLVGGCVRDTLMGNEPHDYDLTTSALPEQMLTVFNGCKIIETGLKHGTITLLTDGGPIEITTFRIDGEYKDNRRPENVIFTPKLSEDLARRDFTVNAIAMDKEGNLVDLYGGENDIRSKIIRCVGDPEKRFNEDGLRILRALRFASTLNFEIHPDTEKAIFKLTYLLKNISAERVREELFKLLCGVSAKAVLINYADVILPFLQPISREDLVQFAEIAEKLPLSAEIRMAALFALYSNTTKLKSAMQALKPSNKQIKSAENCCDIIQLPPTSPTQTALLIGQLGEKEFNLYLQTAKACGKDISATLQTVDDLKSRNACYNLHQLALTGADLIELGVKGKKVGDMLQTLFTAVAEGKVKNEKYQLLNYIKNQT
ncbi:MAG: CCA tRNA nucleotidyltransferase [Clostridia bacterium]|nr:CCA tRNA nucleotidyltransferase [Clostridia bacterium]